MSKSVQKIVRFYTPELIDQNDARAPFRGSRFWRRVMERADAANFNQRKVRFGGADYAGEHVLAVSPAVDYISFGRIRYRSDWPGTIDVGTGQRAPLTLRGRTIQVFENAYLVPFGTANKVAVMGPIRGIISLRAVERWLTSILGLESRGESIVLVPELDAQVQAKLGDALGVKRLNVRVPAGAGFAPPPGKGGVVERALAEAVQEAGDDLDVQLSLSFGRRAATQNWRSALLETARRLDRAVGPDQLEVGLMVPDGDGFKVETHDLIEDHIVARAKFVVEDDTALEEESVLRGIQGAIEEFRGR